MPHPFKKTISQTVNWLGSVFLNGLFTLLPITLTIALFTFVFRQIIYWLAPLKLWLLQHQWLTASLPQSSVSCVQVGQLEVHLPYVEVILVSVFIFFVGLIMHSLLLKRLMQSILYLIESFVFKIPLVRSVYGGIKQLVHAFSMQDKLSFKRVVYAEFPRTGIYSLGFLTSELPQEVSPTQDVKYFNIFIPTTPNPTSGFLIILPEKSIHVVNLSRQEAMAMIISGGIIQPERFIHTELQSSTEE